MTFGLRKAIDLLDWYHAQGRYLNHTLLHRMMDGLTPAERNYLTDYIAMVCAASDGKSMNAASSLASLAGALVMSWTR